MIAPPAAPGCAHASPQSPGAQPASADSPAITIEYWTDPLCCWSWAFEPQWRRLLYEFGPHLRWTYRMGGMIPDWNSYNDPLNAINRPFQLGPLWFQARHVSGMPIDDLLWITNPPASSYPPCIAVKAAQLQSPRAGELYLRRLREAAMLSRTDISSQQCLLALAHDLAHDRPGAFNAQTFARHLDSPAAAQSFREDLKTAAYHNIGRFPTLTFRSPHSPNGVILVGYRPYSALLAALHALVPHLQPANSPRCIAAYTAFSGQPLPREIDELSA